MPAYLDSILVAHRAAAAVDGRDPGRAADEARALAARDGSVGRRDFTSALVAGREARGMAVISEIKRRSPSKGDLDPALDPARVAAEYEAGGAVCLSVLTDEAFFGGSRADLVAARSACGLPVLRKDFTVGPLDVCDARSMGADAVLLIVAALDDTELAALLGLARDLGLAPLVEVHDESELERALAVGADLVGVNQRDLRTFSVDHGRACTLAARIPPEVTAVAESGIRDAADARRLAEAGYDAILVGETLVRAGDRVAQLRELVGHPVGTR